MSTPATARAAVNTAPTTSAPPATARTFPRTPFRRLTSVEWRKATDTRSARWLIAVTIAVVVLIMLVPLLAKNDVDQTYSTYLQFPAMVLTVLLPVVSIMTLTSEWSQRTALTTFTQEPRRSRVIAAKVAVSLWMALGAVVLGAIVTAAALGIAAASGRDLTSDLGAADVIGFAAFILINILMGVAFGALLHNTPAAIVLFFVLPIAFSILGAAVKSVGDWINPSTTFGWVLSGDWDGHVGKVIVSLLLWVVAPLIAGLIRTSRREVS